ncbi:MAG: 30S ribosomal protein S12 methylthiotransferase RimO [Erysipelotrichaceae bacterium]
MKVGFISLGCCKNLVDSENIMGLLKSANIDIVSDPSLADAIIINTCGFINSAKEEAIDTILEMAEYKKQNCKKLIVTGCLAQRYKETLIEELPEVDCFITIKEYPRINEILSEVLDIKITANYGKTTRLISSKPWMAYLKIAEGCSNNCTYCAIPLIRGDNISVPMEELIKEAKELANDGVKELVLIAQDTSKYGLDLYDRLALLDLLKELNDIDGIHWIRILYMYPDEIENSLIEGMAKLNKVLPYFDIPMQHGNDQMLQLMNRRGTIASVHAMINKIRETFPNPTLRTTFIVGFPNETEETFNDLMEFVKEIRWNQMGAFTYSREEDTEAYEMINQVPSEIANDRLDQLMSLQKTIAITNNERMVGQTIEVLVETKDALKKRYRGRGVNSAPDEVDGYITFESNIDIPLGTFVNVLVTKALAYDLIGKHSA